MSRKVVRRSAASLAVVGLMSATAFAATGHDGTASARVSLGAGAAWFLAPARGLAILIDGPSATRVAQVPIGAAGHDLTIAQNGADGYVLDRTDGTLRRLEAASNAASAPVRVGSPGDAIAQVLVSGSSAWTLEQSGTIVQQLDATALAPVAGPLAFPGRPSDAAVASDGTLWLADATSGVVRSYRSGRLRTEATLTGLQAARLVLADDRPVIVDPIGRSAVLVNQRTGRAGARTCLDTTGGDQTLVAGSGPRSPWFLAVDPAAGTLMVGDVRARTCHPVALGGASGSRFGRPVEHGRLVFVPNLTDGSVVVIDPTLERDSVVARIDLGLAGRPFTLSSVNGFAWFDETDGDRAGVITNDLRALVVRKTEGDGVGTAPQPQQPDAPGPAPTTNQISCSVTPGAAVVGDPLTANAVAGPTTPTPDAWRWELGPGATPAKADGPQVTGLTYDSPGPRTVTVIATIGTTEVEATCTLDVTTLPVPSTQPATTVPEATTLPPTSAPPPISVGTTAPTVPATTAPTTAAPTTTTTLAPTTTTTSPAPVSAFTFLPATPKVGDPVVFTDTTAGPHTVTGWTFASATPATATGAQPTATWTVAGTYTVTLTTENGGSANAVQQQVVVAPRLVPSVVGLTQAQATAAITAAGLTVGTVTTVNNLAPVGSVAASNPVANTSVAAGAAVDLSISNAAGAISTVAGIPGPAGSGGDGGLASAAQLNAPTRVTFDSAGNLYIADNKNHVVRKVSTAGVITRVAGTTGQAGFSGDGGPATSAKFSRPRAMVVDAAGNLFISDLDNRRVRKVAPDGTVSTYAGNGLNGSTGNGGDAASAAVGVVSDLAIDPASGDLFIAERYNCEIRRVDKTTHVISLVVGTPGTCIDSPDGTPIGTTTLRDPIAMAFDPQGVLHVAEPSGNRVRRLDLNGVVTTVAGTGVPGYSGDGGPATSAQVHDPDSLVFTGGLLVFTDWSNNRVRAIDAAGNIRTIAGNGTAGFAGANGAPANTSQISLNGVGESSGLAVDPLGAIYLADPGNNCVRRIS